MTIDRIQIAVVGEVPSANRNRSSFLDLVRTVSHREYIPCCFMDNTQSIFNRPMPSVQNMNDKCFSLPRTGHRFERDTSLPRDTRALFIITNLDGAMKLHIPTIPILFDILDRNPTVHKRCRIRC